MKMIGNMQNKEIKIWNIILSITLVEGLIAELVLLSIERDVKNVRFLGLSYSRLALIGFIFLLLLLFTYLLLNKSLRNKILTYIHTSSKLVGFIKWISLFLVFFLWYIVWIPSSRMGTLEAAFSRLQPLLIWIGLIGTQTYTLIKLVNKNVDIQGLILQAKINKKFISYFGIFVFFSSVGFYLLTFLPNYIGNEVFYFPPGAPLSGLQVFSCWIIFIFIFLFENKNESQIFNKKTFIVISFLAIWLVAILLWASAPFPCTDDRPGPYPPNYLCYPQVNDAMYSIGSHNLALGQGMSNQDKPLFVIFLAVGQWIFGPTIDNYLLFQIIVFALIPGLLFIFGKKIMGYSGGLLLAVLTIIQGAYSIILYEKTGSVNAKLENPELFTAVLLLLLCFMLFNWIKMPDQKIWAILSGGILGLSILVRFNTVMIIPVIFLVFGIANLKKKKLMVSSLGLFILLIGITSIPGFFAQGQMGEGNFLLGKIVTVLNTRIKPDSQPQETLPITMSENTISPTMQVGDNVEIEGSIKINEENSQDPRASNIVHAVNGMVSHFFNSFYSSLGKLPTELIFESIDDQASNIIWRTSERVPIWKIDLTFQNIIAMFLSLSIIVSGIVTTVKRFGLAGLSPLLIQFGYFIGNAATMTSGGRYLEPVFWVTLIYYVVGIHTLTIIIINFLRRENKIIGLQFAAQEEYTNGLEHHKIVKLCIIIAGFILMGLLPLLVIFIPDQIPVQNSMQLNKLAYEKISNYTTISDEDWESFLSDPDSLVVEGIAYHPRYYRSGYFPSGNPRFELTVLGKQNVFISYFVDDQAINYFSDGSDVILIGCQIDSKTEWYADLVFMETYAVIQMDHEQGIYINDDILQFCRIAN